MEELQFTHMSVYIFFKEVLGGPKLGMSFFEGTQIRSFFRGGGAQIMSFS
jgi:hypothetical protein